MLGRSSQKMSCALITLGCFLIIACQVGKSVDPVETKLEPVTLEVIHSHHVKIHLESDRGNSN